MTNSTFNDQNVPQITLSELITQLEDELLTPAQRYQFEGLIKNF